MQAHLLSLLAKYPKLAALGDIAKLRSNQIGVTHLERIADAFNTKLPVTPEITEAFIALLKGRNINEVADLIQSPESLADLVTFFREGYQGLAKEKQLIGSDSELLQIETANPGENNVLYIT